MAEPRLEVLQKESDDPFLDSKDVMTSTSPRISSVTLISSPESTKSFDSSDNKSSRNLKTSTKKMIPLKYSCEEIHERMANGLCIFCDEKDSPRHQLKHKNLQIVIVDRDYDDDPVAELEKLQETNGIVEYQKDFQRLNERVNRLEEDLMNMENTARTGKKGTVRRENKAVHKTTTTDDKRLQSTLKRVGVRSVPAIEEVNIFKDNVVIQFINPEVQVSLGANTWVVSGTPQTKKLKDILPQIIDQLGLDNLDSVKKLEEQLEEKIQNPTLADLARDLVIQAELIVKACLIRERLKRRGL